MRLIALTGPIGAGKSEIAKFLMWDRGYYRYPFAARFKRMLLTFGLTEEQVFGRLKEVPCDELRGKTPRYAMQMLGHEWRNLFAEDLWTWNWEKDIRLVPKVVVDDLRYVHEEEAVKRLGGHIIRVHRPGVDYIHTDHASEQYRAPHDGQIINDGDLDTLRLRTMEMEEIYGPKKGDIGTTGTGT